MEPKTLLLTLDRLSVTRGRSVLNIGENIDDELAQCRSGHFHWHGRDDPADGFVNCEFVLLHQLESDSSEKLVKLLQVGNEMLRKINIIEHFYEQEERTCLQSWHKYFRA